VTDFGFSDILDIVYDKIDTKIESAACIQPELEGHTMNVHDFVFEGQLRSRDFINNFDIVDLKNVRIDTKIEFVSCLQKEIRKIFKVKHRVT